MNLPQSTAFGRIIAKDKLYEHGNASRSLQDAFAKQVGRIRWANKIAPSTLNIAAGTDTLEIEIIEIELREPFAELDKRILPLIASAIPYRLVFVLTHGEETIYTVSYNGKLYHNRSEPRLIGSETDSIWDNFVRQISEIGSSDNPIGDALAERERREKLEREIAALDKKSLAERQPRRKLEMFEDLGRLRAELEEL